MKRDRLFSLAIAFALCLTLVPTLTLAAPPAVVASRQNFVVDGKPVEAEVYNIDGSNYFKLRDIACLLMGTTAEFGVGYDPDTNSVTIVPGAAYEPVGGELALGADKSATAVPSGQSIQIQGADAAALSIYNIGGNNFFKLRDLGGALNFYVGYEQETDTAVVRSAYHMEQTDYSEALPASITFEKPVFHGDSEAVQSIRLYFDELETAFANDNAKNALEYVRDDLANGRDDVDDYCADWSTTVFTCTDDLISAGVSYSWYMGGVYDYGMNCCNFDAHSGSMVFLTDVLNGTEDEIRSMIAGAFAEQYPEALDAGVMETPTEAILAKDIRDFSFYVKDGSVHIVFSKYEITYGAAGAFDVTLPEPAQSVAKG